MKRALIKFWCWLRQHDFEWDHKDGNPFEAALVCRRCGHREENGLEWCLKTIWRN